MRFQLLLCLALLTHVARAGWYIGNGGDAIECIPSTANTLSGLYALDYILTLQDPKSDDGLTPVKSWQDSSDRLMRILVNKVPVLADSFKDFAGLVYNKDYSRERVWEPAPFGLTKLDDQRITTLLPENCRSANGEFEIIQAIIRQYEDYSGTQRDHYIYKYFPDVTKRLEAQAPLQLSFLMVHEWLWDISPNVDRNRRINRFLHSTAIENMTGPEVEAALKGMGLTLPDKQPDAFDDNLWQGYPVTEKMFFDRFDSETRMVNLGQLRIDRREREAECQDGNEYCKPAWRKPSTSAPYLDESRARFFLSPSWRFGREKEFPLKIVSPELVAMDKKFLLPGVGEIECRFVDNVDPKLGNLECRFQDPKLIYPLFNLYTDELPMSQWPKMRASLTEECFRLLIRSTQRVEDFGVREGQSSKITETAFTSRFRWRP